MANQGNDHQYKGYTIRLKFGRFRGGSYQILKVIHGKAFKILERNYNFISPTTATKRGCNYIDHFEDKLKQNFKKYFIEYAEKVAANPDNYKSAKGLDIPYFIKAHEKIKNQNITV